jgi:hypothetical protein
LFQLLFVVAALLLSAVAGDAAKHNHLANIIVIVGCRRMSLTG